MASLKQLATRVASHSSEIETLDKLVAKTTEDRAVKFVARGAMIAEAHKRIKDGERFPGGFRAWCKSAGISRAQAYKDETIAGADDPVAAYEEQRAGNTTAVQQHRESVSRNGHSQPFDDGSVVPPYKAKADPEGTAGSLLLLDNIWELLTPAQLAAELEWKPAEEVRRIAEYISSVADEMEAAHGKKAA